jgi:hypothetical protein
LKRTAHRPKHVCSSLRGIDELVNKRQKESEINLSRPRVLTVGRNIRLASSCPAFNLVVLAHHVKSQFVTRGNANQLGNDLFDRAGILASICFFL